MGRDVRLPSSVDVDLVGAKEGALHEREVALAAAGQVRARRRRRATQARGAAVPGSTRAPTAAARATAAGAGRGTARGCCPSSMLDGIRTRDPWTWRLIGS